MKNFEYYLSLAEQEGIKLGLAKDAVAEINSSQRQISYSELQKISSTLRIPLSVLLGEYEVGTNHNLIFRALTDSANKIGLHKVDQYIENIFKILPANFNARNSLQIPIPNENTFQNSEYLSIWFRSVFFQNNLEDPITDLPNILCNKLNIIVKIIELGKNTDGASALVNKLAFIFVSPRFPSRMLFTVAHELGHILNHHSDSEYFHQDQHFSHSSLASRNKIENFANHFASSLLMPSTGVGSFLSTFRELNNINLESSISDIEIIYLSHFYGVSFDVAAMRCEILGLLPKGGAFSLSKYIKEHSGNPEQRAREIGISDREEIKFPLLPNSIMQSLIEKVDNGVYSLGNINDIFGISAGELINYRHK